MKQIRKIKMPNTECLEGRVPMKNFDKDVVLKIFRKKCHFLFIRAREIGDKA